MTVADPNHPITIRREDAVVTVLFEGHSIAQSDDVLLVEEAGYPPVRYFPRDAVQMMFLRASDTATHCPYKGDASYFTLYRDRQIVEDAAWSYLTPKPEMAALAGRIAFVAKHVAFQVGDAAAVDSAPAAGAAPPIAAAQSVAAAESPDVDAVVRHTDSGSGASQAAHWPPNVSPEDEAAPDAPGRPFKDIGAI